MEDKESVDHEGVTMGNDEEIILVENIKDQPDIILNFLLGG